MVLLSPCLGNAQKPTQWPHKHHRIGAEGRKKLKRRTSAAAGLQRPNRHRSVAGLPMPPGGNSGGVGGSLVSLPLLPLSPLLLPLLPLLLLPWR